MTTLNGPSAEFVLTRIFFTFAITLLGSGGAGAAEPSPSEPKGVCEVVSDTKSHGRTVRIRGLFSRGFEKSVLFDRACKERIWVSWGNGAARESEPARRMRGSGGVGGLPVVVEGVFHGNGPDGKPRGYGHLMAYPAMIEVMAVLEAGGKPPGK